jgi:hypothetical protein
MELQENAGNVAVTLPDEVFWIEKSSPKKYGEALGKGEGLCTGIPDYLPKENHNKVHAVHL